MKKMTSLVGFLIMLMLLSVGAQKNVSAGSTPSVLDDPLAVIPDHIEKEVYEFMACAPDNFQLDWTKPMDVSVTNTNPDVVMVETIPFPDSWGYGRYFNYIDFKYRKSGTSEVTLTVESDGKTYEKKCKVTCIAGKNADPLKDMPESEYWVMDPDLLKGYGFSGQNFTVPIEFEAVSSDPEVVQVESYNENFNGYYNVGYLPRGQKPGKATISVTLKVNGETFKKDSEFTCYEHVNPFSEFSIGEQSYTDLMEVSLRNEVNFQTGGKLSYKLKPGYEISKLTETCVTGSFETGDYRAEEKELENGSTISENAESITAYIDDEKNKISLWASLRLPRQIW